MQRSLDRELLEDTPLDPEDKLELLGRPLEPLLLERELRLEPELLDHEELDRLLLDRDELLLELLERELELELEDEREELLELDELLELELELEEEEDDDELLELDELELEGQQQRATE